MNLKNTEPSTEVFDKNLIEIVTNLKKQAEDLKQDPNVEVYRQLLTKAGSLEESTLLTEMSSLGASNGGERKSYQDQLAQAKFHHVQKCREELSQPYIFKDKNLILAENTLILDSFYQELIGLLSTLALSISMTKNTFDQFQQAESISPFSKTNTGIKQDVQTHREQRIQ